MQTVLYLGEVRGLGGRLQTIPRLTALTSTCVLCFCFPVEFSFQAVVRGDFPRHQELEDYPVSVYYTLGWLWLCII